MRKQNFKIVLTITLLVVLAGCGKKSNEAIPEEKISPTIQSAKVMEATSVVEPNAATKPDLTSEPEILPGEPDLTPEPEILPGEPDLTPEPEILPGEPDLTSESEILSGEPDLPAEPETIPSVTEMPEAVQAHVEYFELPDKDIPNSLKEDKNYFQSVTIDGMEYAVADCFDYYYGDADWKLTSDGADFLADWSELDGKKLFLRRREQAEQWEASILEEVSCTPDIMTYYRPFITFNSKENGIIVFGHDLTYIYVTKDGGTTLEIPPEVPEPGEFYHEFVTCIGAGGKEGYFVIGYRYWGNNNDGQVYLTKNNGTSWERVRMAIPEEVLVRDSWYIEPVGLRLEGEKVIAEISVHVNELSGISYYEAVSLDGGETWELANPEEKLEYETEW